MSDFKICELHDAPPASVEDLERVRAKYQFIPNPMGVWRSKIAAESHSGQ